MIVNIKGVIISNDEKWIYDWFGMESTSPNDVMNQIKEANGEPLEVIINSGGGSVYAGSEIYTALMDYKGGVTTKIVGIAASAASLPAMAGKPSMISPTAQLMIHNSSTIARGDYRALRQASDVAKNFNKSIANAYILKSGLSQDELLSLMDKETWLTAQQALEKGFVDEIMFDDQEAPKLVANSSHWNVIPPEVIDKMRNEAIKNKPLVHESPIESPAPQAEEEESIMNIAELQAKHPDVYQAVLNAGAEQERNRIKGIDEIANTIDEALVVKAKYEMPITAEALAFQALKADAGKGIKHLNAREEELDPANAVKAGEMTSEQQQAAAAEAASIDLIAAAANSQRGRMEAK